MILLPNLIMPPGKSHSGYSAMQTGWYGEGDKVKALIITDGLPMTGRAYADLWFYTLLILLMHEHQVVFCALSANGEAQQSFETSVRLNLIEESKSVEKMQPRYDAPLLTDLKLSGLRLALLINFNAVLKKTPSNESVDK